MRRAEKSPAVYIVASKEGGTLYIGVTGDLCSRALQHRHGLVPGFTKKYGVRRLVWIEHFGSMQEAIVREKQMNEWKRAWKIAAIEKPIPIGSTYSPNVADRMPVFDPILSSRPRIGVRGKLHPGPILPRDDSGGIRTEFAVGPGFRRDDMIFLGTLIIDAIGTVRSAPIRIPTTRRYCRCGTGCSPAAARRCAVPTCRSASKEAMIAASQHW